MKVLFDCRRGVWGLFSKESDEKPFMTALVPSGVEDRYMLVCIKVTHEMPYLSK